MEKTTVARWKMNHCRECRLEARLLEAYALLKRIAASKELEVQPRLAARLDEFLRQEAVR